VKRWGKASRSRGRGEDGDTLIEILVAVVLLGVAFVILLEGLATAIVASGYQQNETVADSLARGAAEMLSSQKYIQCAGTQSNGTYSVPSEPAMFSINVSITYWDGTTFVPSTNSTQCPPSGAQADMGSQQLTLTVTTSSIHAAQPEVLQVVKTAA